MGTSGGYFKGPGKDGSGLGYGDSSEVNGFKEYFGGRTKCQD